MSLARVFAAARRPNSVTFGDHSGVAARPRDPPERVPRLTIRSHFGDQEAALPLGEGALTQARRSGPRLTIRSRFGDPGAALPLGEGALTVRAGAGPRYDLLSRFRAPEAALPLGGLPALGAPGAD